MILYYLSDEAGKIHEIEGAQPGCWIALIKPTADEIDAIDRAYPVLRDDITAALDPDEISRVKQQDEYTLFIVDTPVFDKSATVRSYGTEPISLLHTEDVLITVSGMQYSPLLDAMLQEGETHTQDPIQFVYDLLFRNAGIYLDCLNDIENRRAKLSEGVQRPTKKSLLGLYELERYLVYFKTSLATNRTSLQRILGRPSGTFNQNMAEQLGDVLVEINQASEMTDVYTEILDSTMNQFSALMGYDLNNTIRLLTVITLILCIPTVISGLFGMNVLSESMPFADHPYGFLIITLLSFGLCALLALWFHHRKWL